MKIPARFREKKTERKKKGEKGRKKERGEAHAIFQGRRVRLIRQAGRSTDERATGRARAF